VRDAARSDVGSAVSLEDLRAELAGVEGRDIILGHATPTPAERVLCDDCNGTIDILDVPREIDAILGRIPQPPTCPT
jgi:hypothetical protein